MTTRSIFMSGLLMLLLAACGGDKLIKSHYDTGELKTEWHINAAGQKHGLERQYYASGELKGVVKYVEDRMDSVATYYWKNGKPRKRVEYKDGELSGTTTWFHNNGKPEKEETYREDGKREGPSRQFYPDGTPKSVVVYEDGYRQGLSQTWHPNGKLETEQTYRGGRVDGEFARYHPSGKMKQTGIMMQGRKAGQWREYDEDGRELFECVYVGDVPNGAFTVYYPSNGRVHAIGELRKGLLHGQVMVYNENGGRIRTQQWVDGQSADGKNDLSWLPSSISLKAEDLIAD